MADLASGSLLASKPFQLYRHLALGGDGILPITITGDKTITVKHPQCLAINGGLSTRVLTLPTAAAGASKGMFFVIRNSGTTNDLTINKPASTLVVTLNPGEACIVVYGTAWTLAMATSDPASDTLLAQDNAWTGTNDFSKALTTTDELINADITMTHATQVAVAVDATAVQLTNARTAGYVAPFRAKLTSLAGDLNGIPYSGLHVLAPTDGGGAVLHSGVYVEAGNDYSVHGLDNVCTAWGTGAAGVADATMGWDATNLTLLCSVDDSVYKIGDGTLCWDVWIYGNTAADYLLWDASTGLFSTQGAAAFGAITSSGTHTKTSTHLEQNQGGGTGTGAVVKRFGVLDTVEGLEERIYDAVVSPAAIETALFTIPANSVVDSVQANVDAALTGGGTSVTFSIGITGDVDAYGTAGAPTDLLTKNAKLNAIGTKASGAGASVGIFSGGTTALKLIAAATGGTTAGDTALTVGSVRVVVRYRTLINLKNHA